MGINVFGEKIITCSNYPLTGFFRDGCCNTDKDDLGIHTVCVIITNKFLSHYKLKNLKRGIQLLICCIFNIKGAILLSVLLWKSTFF